MKNFTIKRALSVLLVMTMIVTSLSIQGETAYAASKTVKSVSLKIGSKNVTKRIFKMTKGKNKKLKVLIKPTSSKKTVTYKSKNKKIVTVSRKGKLKAKNVGTAKIIVKVKGKKGKSKQTWVKVKVTKKKKQASTDNNIPNPDTPVIPNEPGEITNPDLENNTTNYTVTFDLNYDSASVYKTVSVVQGQKVVKPEDPDRKGSGTFDVYAFKYWSIDSAGEKQFDFDTAITSNVVLYAQWDLLKTGSPIVPPSGGGGSWSGGFDTPTTTTYSVKFYMNDGTDVTYKEEKVISGSAINVPQPPVRDGYTFKGWYTDVVTTNEYDFSRAITQSLNLYAKWVLVKDEPILEAEHRIIFDLNDGSGEIYETQVVKHGEKATRPSLDPNRNLYRFTGWYMEPNAVTVFDFNTPVTYSSTLYAGWGNPDVSAKGVYSATDTEKTVYSITNMQMSDDKASVNVTFNTNSSAVLVVDFFTDTVSANWNQETMKDNLAQTPIITVSAMTPEYGELTEVSIPIDGALPDYFLACVRLMGTNESDEIVEYCKPYICIEHTKNYEKFNATSVNDYPGKTVINFDEDEYNNFGVLKDDVVKITSTEISNVLTVEDIDVEGKIVPDHVYSFAKPDSTVRQLKAGDKLFVSGTSYMFKIKSIVENNDGSLSFTSDNTGELTDYYEVLKVNMEPSQPDDKARIDIIDIDKTFSAELGYEINLPLPDKNGGYSGVDLQYTQKGKVSVKVSMLYDAKWFKDDFFKTEIISSVDSTNELSFVMDTDDDDGINIDKKGKFSKAIKIPKFRIPTPIVGLDLYCEPSVPLEGSLEARAGTTITVSEKNGFTYDSYRGKQDVKEKTKTVNLFIEGKGEVSVGPKVSVGLGYLGDIVTAEISAQAGVKITGVANINTDDHLDNTVDSKHNCMLCIAGEADWFFDVHAKLSYDICRKLSGDIFDVTIISLTSPVDFAALLPGVYDWTHDIPGVFFVSIINSNDSPFSGKLTLGAGECINRTYRTKFTVQDSSGNTVEGVPLTVQNQNYKESGNSTYQLYLYPGRYTVQGVVDKTTLSKEFIVDDDAQDIILSAATADGKLSGIITSTVSSDQQIPLAGATITIKKGWTTIASAESDSDGNYTIDALPAGSFIMKVTASGHKDALVNITILNGQTSYHNVSLIPKAVASGGFSGRMIDAVSGNPVAGVELELRKGENAPSTDKVLRTLITDSNGRYKYSPVKIAGLMFGEAPGNYTVTAKKDGYQTKVFNIVILPNVMDAPHGDEPISQDLVTGSGSYRIVLRWGKNPRDLDSHVVGTLTNERSFHVYFSHQNQSDNDINVCNLDLDDTNGEGPETITLTPTTDHPYYYYIHKYAGNGDIAHSNATVEVYDETGLIQSFNAPTNQGSGKYWNIFAIVNDQLIIKNTITNSSDVRYATPSLPARTNTEDINITTLTEDNMPKNNIY